MNPSSVFILQFLLACMECTQILTSNKLLETRSKKNYSPFEHTPANNGTSILQRPLFPVNKHRQLSFNPSNYKCNQKYSSLCKNKTIAYREKVLSEFKTSMMTEKREPNFYNVEYEHSDDMLKYNPVCMILDAKVRYLKNSDTPFDTSEIGYLFPKRELFDQKFLSTSKSCIIVSSAGSLYNSGLGKFIGMYNTLLLNAWLNAFNSISQLVLIHVIQINRAHPVPFLTLTAAPLVRMDAFNRYSRQFFLSSHHAHELYSS